MYAGATKYRAGGCRHSLLDEKERNRGVGKEDRYLNYQFILSLHSSHFHFLLATWEKCKKWGNAIWEQKIRNTGIEGWRRKGWFVHAELHLIKCLWSAIHLLSSPPPLLIFCLFPPNALYSCIFRISNPLG